MTKLDPTPKILSVDALAQHLATTRDGRKVVHCHGDFEVIHPGYDCVIKCSHLFNVLDASNSIGVTERTAFILRIRQLAIGVARTYVEGGAKGDALAEASSSEREA